MRIYKIDWVEYDSKIIDGTSFELYRSVDGHQALLRITDEGTVLELKQSDNFIKGFNSYFAGLNLFDN